MLKTGTTFTQRRRDGRPVQKITTFEEVILNLRTVSGTARRAGIEEADALDAIADEMAKDIGKSKDVVIKDPNELETSGKSSLVQLDEIYDSVREKLLIERLKLGAKGPGKSLRQDLLLKTLSLIETTRKKLKCLSQVHCIPQLAGMNLEDGITSHFDPKGRRRRFRHARSGIDADDAPLSVALPLTTTTETESQTINFLAAAQTRVFMAATAFVDALFDLTPTDLQPQNLSRILNDDRSFISKRAQSFKTAAESYGLEISTRLLEDEDARRQVASEIGKQGSNAATIAMIKMHASKEGRVVIRNDPNIQVPPNTQVSSPDSELAQEVIDNQSRAVSDWYNARNSMFKDVERVTGQLKGRLAFHVTTVVREVLRVLNSVVELLELRTGFNDDANTTEVFDPIPGDPFSLGLAGFDQLDLDVLRVAKALRQYADLGGQKASKRQRIQWSIGKAGVQPVGRKYKKTKTVFKL